jgi:nicotinamidase-related amidase
MRDCTLLVDVFDDFRHDDGDRLLASFLARVPVMRDLVARARSREEPLIYANDSRHVFDGDARGIVARARAGPAGAAVDGIAPAPGDRFVIKPRYSAFDLTPLELILDELEIERVVLAGMSTEACVTQTAIAAREAGFKVTVVADGCATVDTDVEAIALAYLERVVGVQVSSLAALDAREVPSAPATGIQAS